ncbi:MAG: hypothetical protein ACOYIK_07285 [Coriobacteriales bacterium]|jgi:hypothetical protein
MEFDLLLFVNFSSPEFCSSLSADVTSSPSQPNAIFKLSTIGIAGDSQLLNLISDYRLLTKLQLSKNHERIPQSGGEGYQLIHNRFQTTTALTVGTQLFIESKIFSK